MRPDGVRLDSTIRSVKKLGRHFVFSFRDIPDLESASALRGSSICISRGEVVLEKNEFFCDQIIGLRVFTTDGEMIGCVEEILETGGNDVYVVRMHSKEYLLPAIKDVVREIDLDKGRIVVKPMPGLLD
jgi:16S rRNA processing protein RimM